MILTRQKLFFKGEKEMLEELKNNTGNFKHFPHALRNQTAKDVASGKLSNITNYLGTKLSGERDNAKRSRIKNLTEDDKEFLARIGLPKTAKNLERVVDKYTNTEAIERWKKMYPNKWKN